MVIVVTPSIDSSYQTYNYLVPYDLRTVTLNYISTLKNIFNFLDIQSTARAMLACELFRAIGEESLKTTHAKKLTSFKIERFFMDCQKGIVSTKELSGLDPTNRFYLESQHPLQKVFLLRDTAKALNRTNPFHFLYLTYPKEGPLLHVVDRDHPNVVIASFTRFDALPPFQVSLNLAEKRTKGILEEYTKCGSAILNIHSISKNQLVTLALEGQLKKYQVFDDAHPPVEESSAQLITPAGKKFPFICTGSWLIGDYLFISQIEQIEQGDLEPMEKLQCYAASTGDLIDEKVIPSIHYGLNATAKHALVLCSKDSINQILLISYECRDRSIVETTTISVNKEINCLVANESWILAKGRDHFAIYKNDGSLWWEFTKSGGVLFRYTGVQLIDDLMVYIQENALHVTHLNLKETFIFEYSRSLDSILSFYNQNIVHLDLEKKSLFFKIFETRKSFYASTQTEEHLYRLSPASKLPPFSSLSSRIAVLPPVFSLYSQTSSPTLTFLQKICQAMCCISRA